MITFKQLDSPLNSGERLSKSRFLRAHLLCLVKSFDSHLYYITALIITNGTEKEEHTFSFFSTWKLIALGLLGCSLSFLGSHIFIQWQQWQRNRLTAPSSRFYLHEPLSASYSDIYAGSASLSSLKMDRGTININELATFLTIEKLTNRLHAKSDVATRLNDKITLWLDKPWTIPGYRRALHPDLYKDTFLISAISEYTIAVSSLHTLVRMGYDTDGNINDYIQAGKINSHREAYTHLLQRFYINNSKVPSAIYIEALGGKDLTQEISRCLPAIYSPISTPFRLPSRLSSMQDNLYNGSGQRPPSIIDSFKTILDATRRKGGTPYFSFNRNTYIDSPYLAIKRGRFSVEKKVELLEIHDAGILFTRIIWPYATSIRYNIRSTLTTLDQDSYGILRSFRDNYENRQLHLSTFIRSNPYINERHPEYLRIPNRPRHYTNINPGAVSSSASYDIVERGKRSLVRHGAIENNAIPHVNKEKYSVVSRRVNKEKYSVPPNPNVNEEKYSVPPNPNVNEEKYSVPPNPNVNEEKYSVPPSALSQIEMPAPILNAETYSIRANAPIASKATKYVDFNFLETQRIVLLRRLETDAGSIGSLAAEVNCCKLRVKKTVPVNQLSSPNEDLNFVTLGLVHLTIILTSATFFTDLLNFISNNVYSTTNYGIIFLKLWILKIFAGWLTSLQVLNLLVNHKFFASFAVLIVGNICKIVLMGVPLLAGVCLSYHIMATWYIKRYAPKLNFIRFIYRAIWCEYGRSQQKNKKQFYYKKSSHVLFYKDLYFKNEINSLTSNSRYR